ncbi:hypothetical protein T492DRAFT_874380 [Pavlovales sp. CCMP2436]|nr:hypothetical protein T492DRAFT_874380 [Pavlovales sp. CCMP2436]
MPGTAFHGSLDLAKVYPTYHGPGPRHGTWVGYARGVVSLLYVITMWNVGLLMNVFNLMQPTPSAPQLAVALPTIAGVYYGIFLATGSSVQLTAAIIGFAILFVDSGDYYEHGAHTCYEFELSEELPRGIW